MTYLHVNDLTWKLHFSKNSSHLEKKIKCYIIPLFYQIYSLKAISYKNLEELGNFMELGNVFMFFF